MPRERKIITCIISACPVDIFAGGISVFDQIKSFTAHCCHQPGADSKAPGNVIRILIPLIRGRIHQMTHMSGIAGFVGDNFKEKRGMSRFRPIQTNNPAGNPGTGLQVIQRDALRIDRYNA